MPSVTLRHATPPALQRTARVATVPLESKWIEQGWKSEARTIDGKFGRGILATKSVLDITGNTWAVPAPLLALLLQ